MKDRYPEHRQAARQSGFGVPAAVPERSALEVDPDERTETYRNGFEAGSLVGMLLSYNDLIIDKLANDTAAEYIRSRIREIVKSPDVADLLSPTDHPFGTKRPCLDTGYYATFNRDNVKLVDVRKTPIVEITETGIRTSDESYEFDSIVFATGFDAMTGALLAVDIRGRGNHPLREKWAAGPRTYLGVGTSGFPNLFMITGPGSPSVLSNMIVSIEQHVEWIADCMAAMRGPGSRRHRGRRGMPRTSGWRTSTTPGTPRSSRRRTPGTWGPTFPASLGSSCPTSAGSAPTAQKCDEVAANGYEGFALLEAGRDAASVPPQHAAHAGPGGDGQADVPHVDQQRIDAAVEEALAKVLPADLGAKPHLARSIIAERISAVALHICGPRWPPPATGRKRRWEDVGPLLRHQPPRRQPTLPHVGVAGRPPVTGQAGT